MAVCISCGADMPGTRCQFCYCEAPTEQAKWMKPEAVSFMKRHRNAPAISVGPRSKFSQMASSLRDLRVFKFAGYTGGIVTYQWTDYGRALLQELKVA